MKLLVDMNLSPRWVGFLGNEGIEAAHWSSLGSANAPDSVIGAQVASALRQMAAELDSGVLLTIDPIRTRLRVLPLHTPAVMAAGKT